MPRQSNLVYALVIATAAIAGFTARDAGADCANYANSFHWISTVPTPSPANRLAAANGLVLIASGAPGLMVYDATDPHDPQLLTTLNTPGSCTDVVVSGTYAFVADGASGLQVVDVLNPSAPEIVRTLVPGTVSSLGLDGDRIGAIGGGQFYVIDVAVPLDPVVVGATPVSGAGWDVNVRGDYAYLGGVGMRIIDLTDPAHPLPAGLFSAGAGSFVSGLDVLGQYVCVAIPYAGFETGYNILVDVSDPLAPTEVWTEYNYLAAYDVAFVGSVAFVFGDQIGYLEALDFSVPAAPTRVASQYYGYAGAIVSDGEYLYGTGYDGLHIYDVSPLEGPPVAATLDNVSYPSVMCTGANRVYTSGRVFGDAWMDVIDSTDPAVPVLRSYIDLGHLSIPTGLAAAGDYVYAGVRKWSASGQSGLVVVDVSNPVAPSIVAIRTTIGGGGVAVGGGFVYLAQKDSTIAIFELLTPSGPFLRIQYRIPGAGKGLTLDGNRLYVAAGVTGMIILDVSSPVTPVFLSTTDTPHDANAIALRGTIAFVADGWASGLRTFDVSNPAQPVPLGGQATTSNSLNVALLGDFAYVADDDHVSVLNVADPAVPFVTGAHSRPISFNDVAVVGGYIYACGTSGELDVLSRQCGPTGASEPAGRRLVVLELSPPSPNPSAGMVRLLGRLPEGGRYDAAVFDVRGRIVRDLPPIVSAGPGPVEIRWDGLDRRGRQVAGGIYYLTLSGRGATAVQKVAVVR